MLLTLRAAIGLDYIINEGHRRCDDPQSKRLQSETQSQVRGRNRRHVIESVRHAAIPSGYDPATSTEYAEGSCCRTSRISL